MPDRSTSNFDKTAHRVDVTAEDIANGRRTVADACPVALAASRHFKRRVLVGVLYATTYAPSGRATRRGELPTRVGDRIAAFDQGKGMKPFSFTLRTERI